MPKRRPARELDVCLLTPHPLAARAVQDLLPQPGFRFKVVPLRGGDLLTDFSSVPPASVYIIDAYTCPQYAADVVSRLAVLEPNARVIAMAEGFAESETMPLLRSGARGLLSHTDVCERLPQAIDVVAAGRFWVPRLLMSHALQSMLEDTRDSRVGVNGSFTPREQQVLRALLDNLSNKEIASKLNMAERTAKFYVSKLLARFGVRRRADLILLHFQSQAKDVRPADHPGKFSPSGEA